MDQEVRPVLDGAMKNIDRVFNATDGTYGYRIPNDSFNKAGARTHSLTGVGVLSKLFWLGRVDRDTRAAFKDIQSHELHYNDANCNLYAWYYDTQACFQAQGQPWDWWNQRFQDLLISQQSSDGSWPPAGQGAPGICSSLRRRRADLSHDALLPDARGILPVPALDHGRWHAEPAGRGFVKPEVSVQLPRTTGILSFTSREGFGSFERRSAAYPSAKNSPLARAASRLTIDHFAAA